MTLTQRTSITIIDDVPNGGATGQVLTKASNADYDLVWASAAAGGGSGTVTSVSAGIGLTSTPNPITGAGQIDIASTGVSAGIYTLPTLTINAQGQIVSAANGSAGSGTVTSAGVVGNNGITVAGSPITTQGVFTLGLGDITPTNITTSAANFTGNLSGFTAAFSGIVSANAGIRTTFVSASGNLAGANFSGSSNGSNTGDQTITLTGDVSGSGTASFAATINPNSVTYGKIQKVSASRILGNPFNSVSACTEIGLGSTLAFSGGQLQTLAITGDVSAPANSYVTTINPGAVTNTKLANMAAVTMKANAKTSAAVPADVTFSTFLDAAVSAAQGDIIFRGTSLWTRLAAGVSGQYLQTLGVSANPAWVNITGGAGTVTSVSAGGGLTASTNPIVATGDISIANAGVTYAKIQAVSASSLLGNSFNSTSAVGEIGLGATLNFVTGQLQTKAITGDVSAGANSYATTINPGVVSNSKLSNMNAVTMKCNPTTSAAVPVDASFSTFLDASVSAAQGDIIYRGASTWTRLAAGTSGQYLQTLGVSANPAWTTIAAGSGTVTSAGVVGNNGISVAGSPITTQGVFTLGLGNITPTTVSTGVVSASTVNATGDIQAATGRVLASAATITGKLTGQAASFSAIVSADAGLNTTTISAASISITGDINADAGRIIASAASIKGIVSATNFVSTVVSVAFNGATTVDASQGSYFRGVAVSAFNLSANNVFDGQKIIFEIIQDATGSRVMTLGGNFALGTDITSATLTTTANKRDFLGALGNTTANKLYITAFAKGY